MDITIDREKHWKIQDESPSEKNRMNAARETRTNPKRLSRSRK